MSSLIDFYRGLAPDSEGRTLAEILAFSDDQMEAIHDFIQWIFPLPEPSRFNPDAPLLTESDIAAFREDQTLSEALRHSFRRFLKFLGLTFGAGVVSEGRDFALKAEVWRYPNHNWLRITRVLTSTRILGLETESLAFLAWLESIRRSSGSAIDDRTFDYWLSGAARDNR